MGHTTDFIGHIDITPSLNEAEIAYLIAFADSRRCRRPGGPYEVPGNPAAELHEHPEDLDAYNAQADGQPSFWCQWQPAWSGNCLSYDGREKFYGATRWLQYLIDHFLAPGAMARTSGLPCFADFTFDHVLDGVVAACRRDTRELYLIVVEENTVTRRTVMEPIPWQFELGPLPYEQAIDDLLARRRRRRISVAQC